MKPQLRLTLVAILTLVLVPGQLLAAGFGIYEQSAKASGLAGAWVARADDAAANWYNPAALIWLEGSEFQFGTNIINTGDSELTSSDPAFGLSQPTTFEQESNLATPSHLYYRTKLNNNVAFGIGVTTPFGLVTEWADRPVTFSAAKSELATFVINPNVAFRLTESWSVAVGVDYILADLSNFSREVPVDLDGNPLNGFEVIGFSNLSGERRATSSHTQPGRTTRGRWAVPAALVSYPRPCSSGQWRRRARRAARRRRERFLAPVLEASAVPGRGGGASCEVELFAEGPSLIRCSRRAHSALGHGRWSRSFSRQAITMRPVSSESLGLTSWGGSGSSLRCLAMMTAPEVPSKTGRPVSA